MIVSVKDNSLEKLTLGFPENSENVLYSEIYNGNEPFYVQSPRVHYKINDDKTVSLLFDDERLSSFFDLILQVEKRVCQLISEKSESWFAEKMDYSSIWKNLFRRIVAVPENLKDPLEMKVKIPKVNGEYDFEIYNKMQKKLDFSAFEKSTECTFLLLAKEIVISSTVSEIEWELVQVLIHKKKKKVKGFGIRNEEDIQINIIN